MRSQPAEPGAEVGHRREREDDRRPADDREPEPEGCVTHDPMIGSALTRSAVREPGASPGRSRRCEGRCSPATRHWPPGREGGGGGCPESEDLPRSAHTPEPLAEGGFRCCIAGSFSPPRAWRHSRSSSRAPPAVTLATAADFPVTITAGNGKVTIAQATAPHRLALADRDRVALRDRRRQAGDRRRRPVRLPEDRAPDGPLGLRPQRGGDRRVRARSRDHRLRPEGPVGRPRAARHPSRPPRRGPHLPGRVPAASPARPRHRAEGRRNEGHRPDEDADRTPGQGVEGQGGGSHRLSRADSGLLLGVVELLRGQDLHTARPAEHRGRS